MDCRKSFSRQKHSPAVFKEFGDFQKLIVGKTNRENLWEEKQVSRKTLSTKFKVFFDKFVSVVVLWWLLPPILTKSKESWILAIDGKWLRRSGVVMIYRDITNGENLFWSFHSGETYTAIQENLRSLTKLLGDHQPSGVISDWKGSIVSGVDSNFDHLPHQRCLAHVVREVRKLLPKNSSIIAVLVLRKIGEQLPDIKTKQQEADWKAQLIRWQEKHSKLLTTKSLSPTETNKRGQPRWWYTHSNLRRAWYLLTNNWHPFFVHIYHPTIPNTNNSIEGVNSQLKNKLLNHRGMKTLQQVSFLFWYLIFTRTKTKADLKKVWDYWKIQKTSELDTQKVT